MNGKKGEIWGNEEEFPKVDFFLDLKSAQGF